MTRSSAQKSKMMKNVSCEQYDIFERLAMHKTLLTLKVEVEGKLQEFEGYFVDFRVKEGVEHGYLNTGESFPLIAVKEYKARA